MRSGINLDTRLPHPSLFPKLYLFPLIQHGGSFSKKPFRPPLPKPAHANPVHQGSKDVAIPPLSQSWAAAGRETPWLLGDQTVLDVLSPLGSSARPT